VQSANDTLSDEARGAIQSEYDHIMQEIDGIAQETEFNGQKLFDSDHSFEVLVGSEGEANEVVSVDTPGFSSSDVGGTDLSSVAGGLGTQSGAQTLMDRLDSAHGFFTGRIASLGSSKARLGRTVDAIQGRIQAKTSAVSRIEDSDMALEKIRVASAKIRQQTSAAMMAQANMHPGILFHLDR
jgi:flagellin